MKRALIVDDEETITFAFKRYLSHHGLIIDTASTTQEAFSLLDDTNYHAVITDLRLSGADEMEGLKVIREARRHSSKVYIIAATAFGSDGVKSAVLQSGADIYLEKPVSGAQIRQILLDAEVAQPPRDQS